MKQMKQQVNPYIKILVKDNSDLKIHLDEAKKQYEKKNKEFMDTNEIIIKLKNENDILKRELSFTNFSFISFISCN